MCYKIKEYLTFTTGYFVAIKTKSQCGKWQFLQLQSKSAAKLIYHDQWLSFQIFIDAACYELYLTTQSPVILKNLEQV